MCAIKPNIEFAPVVKAIGSVDLAPFDAVIPQPYTAQGRNLILSVRRRPDFTAVEIRSEEGQRDRFAISRDGIHGQSQRLSGGLLRRRGIARLNSEGELPSLGTDSRYRAAALQRDA